MVVYKSYEAVDRYWLDQQLDDRGKTTVGEVERILEGGGYKDWSDNIVYTYTVDGEDYERWANGWNGEFDGYYPAGDVTVEYLPENPARARIAGYRQGEEDVKLLLSVLLIFGMGSAFVYWRERVGRSDNHPPPPA